MCLCSEFCSIFIYFFFPFNFFDSFLPSFVVFDDACRNKTVEVIKYNIRKEMNRFAQIQTFSSAKSISSIPYLHLLFTFYLLIVPIHCFHAHCTFTSVMNSMHSIYQWCVIKSFNYLKRVINQHLFHSNKFFGCFSFSAAMTHKCDWMGSIHIEPSIIFIIYLQPIS